MGFFSLMQALLWRPPTGAHEKMGGQGSRLNHFPAISSQTPLSKEAKAPQGWE
jgi:hypothetical protein